MSGINHSLPELPVKRTVSEIVGFIRRITFNSRPYCILGLSGGIDSATVAYLLVEALGSDKVKVIILPYHQSDKQHIEDALLVANNLKLSYQIIDITSSINSYFRQFSDADHFRKGNKIARERMAVLYDMSTSYNGIVAGTGNKSELLLGYFTKYGDGGVDCEPIGGLYKTYIYELAKHLGIPEGIIKKPPTADLWPGQTDENELGIEYSIADQILYCMVDKGEEIEKIIGRGFNEHQVKRVADLYCKSEHKRATPPMPDIMQLLFHKELGEAKQCKRAHDGCYKFSNE